MSILFNNGNGYGINPNDGFIPYNNNGNFSNSPFFFDETINYLSSYNNGDPYGLNLDFNAQIFQLGDFALINNSTYLAIDDGSQRLILSPNLQYNTAGVSSGKFLQVAIGTNLYKIALLNN